jgi:hypothetical protein
MSDLLKWAKILDGDLDREIESLRDLTAAITPREESSSLVEGTVRRIIGEGASSPEKELYATGIQESRNRDPLASGPLASDRKFVPVDDLPLEDENPDPRWDASRSLEERCGDSRGRNQYSPQLSDPRVDRSAVAPFRDSAQTLGGIHFPIHAEIFTGGGDYSVRRTSGVQNVTTRETIRPKEREKDKEYRRLTLNRTDFHSLQLADRDEGQAQFVGRNGGSVTNEHGSKFSPAHSVPSPFGQPNEAMVLSSSPGKLGNRNSPQADPVYEITLVNEGRTQRHRVFENLRVSQLAVEAAGVFSLDPNAVVLMLFSTALVTLDRKRTLVGPPRVNPNATVIVFVVMGIPVVRSPIPADRSPYTARGGDNFAPGTREVPRMHSKLLGTFKLPKFDRTPKAWKQWDRDVVRFLGLHQLEHVHLEPASTARSRSIQQNCVLFD